MRIKASFTLENSVIIPIFVVLDMLFIMIVLDMHDQIVVRSIDIQVAMKLEQELNESDISKKGEIYATAVTNIRKKCVLDNEVSEQIVEERCKKNELITENRQPDFLRVVSAGLKLLDK